MDYADIRSIESGLNKINIYVGGDGKLHFVNSGGADTALNFSSGKSSYGIHFWMLDNAADSSATYVVPSETTRIHIDSFTNTDSNIGWCKIRDGANGDALILDEVGNFSNRDVYLDPTHWYTIEIQPRYFGYHADFLGTGYF